MIARSILRRASGRARPRQLETLSSVLLPPHRERERERDMNGSLQAFHTDSSLREFRSSPIVQSTTPLVVGLGVAAIAYGGKVAVEAFDSYQSRQQASQEKGEDGSEETTSKSSTTSWFSFGTRYYEGGFEPEMTRREAALILGIRESSPRERVREAHRRLAIINHPDQGGSTFVAAKINEAKDKLLGSA